MLIRSIFAMWSSITEVRYEVTRSQTISSEYALELVLTQPVAMRAVFSLVSDGSTGNRAMGAGIIATVELSESCCCHRLILEEAIYACIQTTKLIMLRTNVICI